MARLHAAADSGAVTIVTAEEQLRGWLAKIHRIKDARDQIGPYRELGELLQIFNRMPVIPFDNRAADEFGRLRQQKVRIGTLDLKIAAITLANDALLLTANRRVFARVPGLRFENWLDSPRRASHARGESAPTLTYVTIWSAVMPLAARSCLRAASRSHSRTRRQF